MIDNRVLLWHNSRYSHNILLHEDDSSAPSPSNQCTLLVYAPRLYTVSTFPLHSVCNMHGDSRSRCSIFPPLCMTRFQFPHDDEDTQSPWENAKGSDSPELNHELPEFLVDHFRRRHDATVRGGTTFSDVARDEREFLRSLDLTPLQETAIGAMVTELQEQNAIVKPNCTQRVDLAADLRLMFRTCRVEEYYDQLSQMLYVSYVFGHYRPDAIARDNMIALLARRMFRKTDEKARLDFPYEEFTQYLHHIGVWGAWNNEAHSGDLERGDGNSD